MSLLKELRIVVDRFYGNMHHYQKLLLAIEREGAWYNPDRDVICIFGNKTFKDTILSIDHEFLHRILINLEDLETTKALDNLEEYFINLDEEDVD